MISRTLYLLFFYYLVLEGAARKWLFPSASNELFLLKDLLLIGALSVLYSVESHKLAALRPLALQEFEKTLFFFWGFFVLVGLAVAGFSLTGFIGLRYYIIPLLMLPLQPLVAFDELQLERFFRDFLVLSALICMLGFVQFTSASDAPINRYSWSPNSEMDVATFGEVTQRITDASYVRITGTFSYISPYASYLQFAFFCAIGMFVVARSERARLLYAAIIVGILANLFMTGSRAPAIASILVATLFLPNVRAALGKRFGVIGVGLGLVTVVSGVWLIGDLVSALLERNEAAGDATPRIYGALLMPFFTFMESPFWGEGIGATFLGLGELTGSGQFQYRFDEVIQDRLAVEVGLFGYTFFLFFKIYFLVSTWRFHRRTVGFHTRVWSLVSFSYQLTLMWTIPLYNSVAAIFYFFSIALYMWLRGLEDERVQALRRVSNDGPPHSGLSRMPASGLGR